jgi:NAD(P)-dependent dehydrogenase (short-subunit alcohol dehydrogenase family)
MGVMRLSGRVAIVTGAGDGIGRACAIALAGEGARVVVNDVSDDAAQPTVDQIVESGGKAVVSGLPVGTDAAARAIVDRAVAEFGTVDILVNNAGIGGDVPIEQHQADHIARSLEVNLHGPIHLVHHAVSRCMKERASGRIINVTSRSGLRGKYGESIYAAAKLGIVGASFAWSLELMRYGITVNCVAPAAWTRLLEIMPEPEKTNTIRKREQNVLSRVATPDDVAATFVFLASDESAYLTGQVIEATGQPASLL